MKRHMIEGMIAALDSEIEHYGRNIARPSLTPKQRDMQYQLQLCAIDERAVLIERLKQAEEGNATIPA